MNPYGISPYANVNPGLSNPFAGAQTPFQSQYAVQPPGSWYQQGQAGSQSEYGAPQQTHLSPQQFVQSLGRGPQFGQSGPIGLQAVDAVFLTELVRCGRSLQDVADQLENKDQESQRRGTYAAVANVFYAFGLLSSKGVLIPADLPGRGRMETGNTANACREFGRELERVVERFGSGRGIVEELSLLVERGKNCYAEVTRTIETAGGIETGQEQSRKKAA